MPLTGTIIVLFGIYFVSKRRSGCDLIKYPPRQNKSVRTLKNEYFQNFKPT